MGNRGLPLPLPIGIASIGLTLISTAAFALEGQCCATCAMPPIEGFNLAQAESSACEDACCEHCELASKEEKEKSGLTSKAGFGLPLLAWITPLGGALLVGAHLTNRQFSCACGCCPRVDEPGVAL